MRKLLRSRAFALVVSALGLAGAGPALAAAPAGFTFHVVPDTLQSNEDGVWELDVRMVNASAAGVYGDSLLLIVTPEGAARGGPGVASRPLLVPAQSRNLSAGEDVSTRVSVAASASRARLEVRFYAHVMSGETFEARGVAVASGSVLDGRYPALLARVGGRTVEMVKVPAAPDVAGGAGVLLLPGEDTDAFGPLVAAARLARNGVSVVIVSAPGRGGSQGPDDFAGPASRAAALAGLDTLLLVPGVERARIGAWGISRGATLALLLAIEKPGTFGAVAAQSGCYDLHAAWRAATPAGRASLEAAAGRDSAAWRERSPLSRAAGMRTPTLVYHGERDAVFPVAQARAFADAVEAAGGAVISRLQSAGTHELSFTEPIRYLQSRLSAPR
jgi:predicted esterase